MPYSDFDIRRVQKDFQLNIVEKIGIFADVEESCISEYFASTLMENIPLAAIVFQGQLPKWEDDSFQFIPNFGQEEVL